jgi:hypothetical protein
MWAYAQQGALGDMYFKRWELINNGSQKNTIDSMYVSYWTDVDLGYAGDDLVGCDTTLSMSYCYNGQPTDAVYAPLPPPAVGFDFFQGPVVNGTASDSAIFLGKVVHGEKNLPMTAAYFFVNGDANFGDPPQGQPTGATQFYHFFQGRYGLSGNPFVDENGNITKFAFYGDPVKGTGWLDGVSLPPGDRRQGMASGPFNMAPGDTQEVVVAEMVAGAVPGIDYLQAISLLKVYDQTAQNAYNVFFNLPKAPNAPQVTATGLNNKVVLDWGENNSNADKTENTVIPDKLDGGNYTFQGYNVYQLPYFGATVDQAKLVKTYDVIDGVTTIPYTDPVTRTVEPSISIQNGSDSGVQRYFVDSTDAFNGNKPLDNGSPYYFAVTAYSYNPIGVPQSLENPITILTVTPHSNNPGTTLSTPGAYSQIQHTGSANATLSLSVVDPTKVTGDKYQITIHNETYSLGQNGTWTDVTAASKKGSKVADLTGSSVSAAAKWSEAMKGEIELHFIVDNESPNYDYIDGIKLQLPAGVKIDTAFEPTSNNDGSSIPYTYDKSTNSFVYSTVNADSLASGDSTHRTTNGIFAGGEDIEMIVHASLPLIVNYTMYDDNWGDENGYYAGFIDVSGKDTVSSVANQIITQHQWNVTDLTKNAVVLKNQTIYGGQDIYAQQYYFANNGLNGPGGSSGSNTANVGPGANQTFDGLTAAINGSFNAPTTYQSVTINGTAYTGGEIVEDGYDISDFTIFGYNGTAAASLPLYGGAGGTTSIDQLQQDYQLRWTGVEGDTTINGKTVLITKSGGSIATIFGASNYSIANHPLNPNPGSTKPFTIRIPFQVWNTDKNEQVNLLLYDRDAAKTNDPTKDGFEVWNQNDRVYVWAVNTKYSTSVIDPTSAIVADSATWNWVFFGSKFKIGDVVSFSYANPLQVGKDSFSFTVPAASYSAAAAQQDVNKINVFPNPYYGVNPLETTKYNRFVTFNHLPTSNVTIRIFNLSGFMVKTINHTNGTQFEQWDLTNNSGLPVSSGLYIAYIDMPKLGKTKILKFAIIQEQQIPDHY